MNNSWQAYEMGKAPILRGVKIAKFMASANQKLFFDICDIIVEEYKQDQTSPFVRKMIEKTKIASQTGTTLSYFEMAVLGESYHLLTNKKHSDSTGDNRVPYTYGEAYWYDKELHTPRPASAKLPPFKIFNWENGDGMGVPNGYDIPVTNPSKGTKQPKSAGDNHGQSPLTEQGVGNAHVTIDITNETQLKNQIIEDAKKRAQSLAKKIIEAAQNQAIAEAAKTEEENLQKVNAKAEEIINEARRKAGEIEENAKKAANGAAENIRVEAQRQADEITNEAKQKRDHANEDYRQIIAQARQEAETERDRIVKEAKTERDRIIEEARSAAALESKQTIEKARNAGNAEAKEIIKSAKDEAAGIIARAQNEATKSIKQTVKQQCEEAQQLISEVISDKVDARDRTSFSMTPQIMQSFASNGDAQQAMKEVSSQYQVAVVQNFNSAQASMTQLFKDTQDAMNRIFEETMQKWLEEKQQMCTELETWRFGLYPRKERICIDTYLSNYTFLTKTSEELIRSILESIENPVEEKRIDEKLGKDMSDKLNRLRTQIHAFLCEFEKTIAALGFEVIKPKPGDSYDPRYHRSLDESDGQICTKYIGCTIKRCTRPGVKQNTLSGEEIYKYADVEIDTTENQEIDANIPDNNNENAQ